MNHQIVMGLPAVKREDVRQSLKLDVNEDAANIFQISIGVEGLATLEATAFGLPMAVSVYYAAVDQMFKLCGDRFEVKSKCRVWQSNANDGLGSVSRWVEWSRVNRYGQTETIDDLAFGFVEIFPFIEETSNEREQAV